MLSPLALVVLVAVVEMLEMSLLPLTLVLSMSEPQALLQKASFFKVLEVVVDEPELLKQLQQKVLMPS